MLTSKMLYFYPPFERLLILVPGIFQTTESVSQAISFYMVSTTTCLWTNTV